MRVNYRSTPLDVVSIVDSCRGARRIADALALSEHPIGADAVRKWERFGIPSCHWRGLMKLNKRLNPWDFLLANEKCQLRPARERRLTVKKGQVEPKHTTRPLRWPAPKEH